jgi:hypothetical protein
MRTMRERSAPKAMRTPISGVRRCTAVDRTPYQLRVFAIVMAYIPSSKFLMIVSNASDSVRLQTNFPDMCDEKAAASKKSDNVDRPGRGTQNGHQDPVGLELHAQLSWKLIVHFNGSTRASWAL